MNRVKLHKLLFALLILISFSFSQVTGLSGWDIWIDAGHSQNANMGIYNYAEAWKNLRVALNIEDLLLTMTDIDAVGMTRRDDQVYVGLTERCNMANNWGASWFHSLHSDAGGSTSNSTLLLWGQLANGNPDPPVGGEAMSDIMIDLLTRGMRTYTVYGSIGDCSFYGCSGTGPYLAVNRQTNMPSELSEAGFHTNPRQNQLNMNAEWKRLEAWTFFWSILKFHNITRPTVGILAGIITDVESEVPINGAVASVNGLTYTTDTYASVFHQYSNDPDQLHNGFYYFEDLPNTALEVIVAAPDYYPDTFMVTISDTFFTFQDAQLLSSASPFVTHTIPEEGELAYPAWDPIQINFNREMNTGSVETAFVIQPLTTGEFSWSFGNTLLSFLPDSMEFVTDYSVTILETATDVYGHPFDGDGDGQPGGSFVLNFRSSVSDIFAPVISEMYPPRTSSNIELLPIVTLAFDEEIVNLELLPNIFHLERFVTSTDLTGQLEHYLVGDQTVVSFFPDELLNPSEVYITRLEPGLEDDFENVITGQYNISFQTGNTGWDISGIDDFESGVLTYWWDPAQSGSTTGTIPQNTTRVINSSYINHLTNSTQAMELQYSWDQTAGEWLIREYLGSGPPRDVRFNDSYSLQVYIFGDGNGNQFRFAVDDNNVSGNAADHEVSPWYTIDWHGWKLVTWDMQNDGTGNWLGDGNLDGNMRFDSIQLTYTPGNPTTGSLVFDDLRIVQDLIMQTETSLTSLPRDYNLSQNYPNPFNPETSIEYSLPRSEMVFLAVYNLIGEHIITLVNDYQSAGAHQVRWNGLNRLDQPVSSGVYIYTFKTGESLISKRMLLLK